jgi:Ser/Thr protein kinase RdoA (MazF antagonist)
MGLVPAPRDSPDLATAALAAARTLARSHGLPADDPVVLADGANVVVHLAPAPVVAKAAASSRTIRDAGAFLARELAVAAAVRAAGLPVVAPSDAAPARVHEHDGVAVTFWEHVPLADGALPGPDRLGAMLAELHAALRASGLALPRLAPVDDIPRFAARTGATGAQDRKRIAAAYERLAAQLAPAAEQPLHGDAHPGNLLPAAHGGWLWCDFEDTCAGPLHWDLATLRRSPRLDGAAALRAYGRAARRDDFDDAALAPWIALRELHLTVWYCLYAERRPELRPRAEELLARWRAAQPPFD